MKKLLLLLIIPLFFSCKNNTEKEKTSKENIILNESESKYEESNVALEGPFYDYSEAVDYAKIVNKPILITFTGKACVNARKMENHILSNKEVKRLLGSVIICNLYVDDRSNLENPDTIYITDNYGNIIREKIIRTTGQKWMQLQIEKCQKTTQPYHILDNWQDGPILEPIAYTPDYKVFAKWLENGINEFYNK